MWVVVFTCPQRDIISKTCLDCEAADYRPTDLLFFPEIWSFKVSFSSTVSHVEIALLLLCHDFTLMTKNLHWHTWWFWTFHSKTENNDIGLLKLWKERTHNRIMQSNVKNIFVKYTKIKVREEFPVQLKPILLTSSRKRRGKWRKGSCSIPKKWNYMPKGKIFHFHRHLWR